MRRLLIAIALVLAPGAALAQGAPPSAALQRLMAWGQQLTAIQQPIASAYERCGPVLRELGARLEKKAAASPLAEDSAGTLLPAWRSCSADMRAAVASAKDGYLRMPPIPAEFESALGFDSADVLRRSAASLDGVNAYFDASDRAVDALVAHDWETAAAQIGRIRATGGSVLDGNILLLETVRKGMPLATHKDMMDVRILIARVQREVITTDMAVDDGALSTRLRAFGGQARRIAGRLPADWTRDSAGVRAAVARLNDPRRKQWMASFDVAFGDMAAVSRDMADLLEPLSQGKVAPALVLRIIDQTTQYELRILQASRALATSIN